MGLPQKKNYQARGARGPIKLIQITYRLPSFSSQTMEGRGCVCLVNSKKKKKKMKESLFFLILLRLTIKKNDNQQSF